MVLVAAEPQSFTSSAIQEKYRGLVSSFSLTQHTICKKNKTFEVIMQKHQSNLYTLLANDYGIAIINMVTPFPQNDFSGMKQFYVI